MKGVIVKSIKGRIKEIEKYGYKNKLSYKIRAGFVRDEIVE